jgi:glycerol-3-phosphate acyltransferase PlsX
VQGGIDAARIANGSFEVVFVGNQELIERELEKYRFVSNLPISIVHASEQIDMHESPSAALKRKPDASISVAQRLHRDNKVQAVVSAGNTGAVMASAHFILGRLQHVHRPAICSLLPSNQGVVCLIDVGANIDCKPKNLMQFGIMGSIFMSRIIGVEKPKVGLLNIGEERSKGNELTVQAYELLEKSPINFYGNVEGRDVLNGATDVVVCDGFVGNILLKFAESVGGMVSFHMKRYIGKKLFLNIGAFLLKPSFRNLRKIMSYEEYGGVPLLGVNGVVIIGHGRSTPKAVTNAILEAAKMVEARINDQIEEEMRIANGDKFVAEKA